MNYSDLPDAVQVLFDAIVEAGGNPLEFLIYHWNSSWDYGLITDQPIPYDIVMYSLHRNLGAWLNGLPKVKLIFYKANPSRYFDPFSFIKRNYKLPAVLVKQAFEAVDNRIQGKDIPFGPKSIYTLQNHTVNDVVLTLTNEFAYNFRLLGRDGIVIRVDSSASMLSPLGYIRFELKYDVARQLAEHRGALVSATDVEFLQWDDPRRNKLFAVDTSAGEEQQPSYFALDEITLYKTIDELDAAWVEVNERT
jgi:hypothetical protein